MKMVPLFLNHTVLLLQATLLQLLTAPAAHVLPQITYTVLLLVLDVGMEGFVKFSPRGFLEFIA